MSQLPGFGEMADENLLGKLNSLVMEGATERAAHLKICAEPHLGRLPWLHQVIVEVLVLQPQYIKGSVGIQCQEEDWLLVEAPGGL